MTVCLECSASLPGHRFSCSQSNAALLRSVEGAERAIALSEILDSGNLRTFPTGATRDTASGKPEFAGFLSTRVLRRYAEYMNKHRLQSDGQLRDSDNWKKGIPTDAYMQSIFRHFMDVWQLWEFARETEQPLSKVMITEGGPDTAEALCALLFNAMGMLHEILKEAE